MSVWLSVYFISFFFFKQKTAYEMRISDWSSDVCSSDLRDRAATELAEHMGLEEVAALLWEQPDAITFPVASAGGDAFLSLAALMAGARSLIGRPAEKLVVEGAPCVETMAAAFGEVGRASCRERVGQYG